MPSNTYTICQAVNCKNGTTSNTSGIHRHSVTRAHRAECPLWIGDVLWVNRWWCRVALRALGDHCISARHRWKQPTSMDRWDKGSPAVGSFAIFGMSFAGGLQRNKRKARSHVWVFFFFFFFFFFKYQVSCLGEGNFPRNQCGVLRDIPLGYLEEPVVETGHFRIIGRCSIPIHSHLETCSVGARKPTGNPRPHQETISRKQP